MRRLFFARLASFAVKISLWFYPSTLGKLHDCFGKKWQVRYGILLKLIYT